MDRKAIDIPYPPQSIFRYQVDKITQVTQEKRQVFFLDYISYPAEGGIYFYQRGLKYPRKGFPTPEAVGANNLIKRFLRNQIIFFTQKEFLVSFFPFLLLPWKYKMRIVARWIQGFKQFSFLAIQPYIYEDKRYSIPCQALRKFITVFTEEVGIGNGKWLGLYIAHLIELDNAYRLRMQDILSATSAEELQNSPIKEIKRIGQVFNEREFSSKIKGSFTAVCRLLSIVLVLPRIRRAFKKALSSINFPDLQMDAADHYHTLLAGSKATGGYDWHGKSQKERSKEYELKHRALVIPMRDPQTIINLYPPYTWIGDVRF